MASSFIVSFIAALMAFNYHLPAEKQVLPTDIGQISQLSKEQALINVNKMCIGVATEVFGSTAENMDATLRPLLETLRSQKESSVGQDFLGKYSMDEIIESYNLLCSLNFDPKDEKLKELPIMEGVAYFVKLVNNLPSSLELEKSHKYESSPLVAADGSEMGFANFSQGKQRITVDENDIPYGVKMSFITAEDKNFYKHSGIDLQGIFKAFVNSGSGSQLYGGSTITQQLIKNTLLSYERSLERKINEVLLAYAVTRRFSKDQVLAHYLNHIYFGRGAYGITAAAKAYLGKELDDLGLTDMAFLASLPKNPTNYDPAKNYDIVFARKNRIIKALYANGLIRLEAMEKALEEPIQYITSAEESVALNAQYYADATKDSMVEKLGASFQPTESYLVRTSMIPSLQYSLTRSLQQGLVRYERDLLGEYRRGTRDEFVVSNLSRRIKDEENAQKEKNAAAAKIREQDAKNRRANSILFGRKPSNPEFSNKKEDLNQTENQPTTLTENEPQKNPNVSIPTWQKYLSRLSNVYADTGWIMGVVLKEGLVGLKSGEQVDLGKEPNGFPWKSKLLYGDVVYLEKVANEDSITYFIRKPTGVQGAAVVMDNHTGEVLALSGGFSYKMAPFNRAVYGLRQPGSVMKPFSYLTALEMGYQPNYLIKDTSLHFPPIARGGKPWSPRSFGTPSDDWHSLRMGLEKSNNRMTAYLLKILGRSPVESLNRVRAMAKRFGMYEKPIENSLSFILGAQPTSLLNVASAYASIANGGKKVSPQFIQSIEKEGRYVYRNDSSYYMDFVGGVGSLPLFQLREMLRGVTARGTARILKEHSHYLIGKTGTTDRNQDAWFAGVTPQLSIIVWVGYDNATRGEKRYLVRAGTGGGVAAPIVKSFVESEEFKSTHNFAMKFPKPETSYEVGYFNHINGYVSTPEDSSAIREYFKPGSRWYANYRDAQFNSMDYVSNDMISFYKKQDSYGLQFLAQNGYQIDSTDYLVQRNSPVNSNTNYHDTTEEPADQNTNTYVLEGMDPKAIYIVGTPEYEAYMRYLNNGGTPGSFVLTQDGKKIPRNQVTEEQIQAQKMKEVYPQFVIPKKEEPKQEYDLEELF